MIKPKDVTYRPGYLKSYEEMLTCTGGKQNNIGLLLDDFEIVGWSKMPEDLLLIGITALSFSQR